MTVGKKCREQFVHHLVLADDALSHLGAHQSRHFRDSVEQLQISVEDCTLLARCHAYPGG